MAFDTGIKPQQVSSAMQIMARFGVLDKVKSDDKSVTITLLDVDRGDKRITAYVEGIIKTGQLVSPNTYKVLPASLSRHLGVGEATVGKYLSEMSKPEEGFRPVFTLTRAFTGNSTTIKEPDTSKVDFAMLRREYAKAVDKLDTAIRFLRMPDNEKPDFLDAYFHIKRKSFE
jgi:hypothetical protein